MFQEVQRKEQERNNENLAIKGTVLFPTAAISTNAEQYIRGEELDHHLPLAGGIAGSVLQQQPARERESRSHGNVNGATRHEEAEGPARHSLGH